MAAKNTKTRNRLRMERADAMFPDSDANIRCGHLDVAGEIASIREHRQARQSFEDFDGADWMLDCNSRRILQSIQDSAEGFYNWRDNANDRAELASMMQQAYDDAQAAKELASYRQFEVTSDLLAIPFALTAFQSINLSADELPQIITPKARQYFTVRYMGQDGGARQDQWRTTRSAEEIEMRAISTDKIEYPLLDLQQGNVNEFDKINAQLRFDMEMKIDELAKAMLDAGVVTSGIKDLLNIHPRINQTNIPDDNYLDLTSTGTYGTAHVLTIQRIKAILARMSMWGFGLDPDGPVRIKSMIMSPLHARDSWDYVDNVTGWNTTGESNPVNTVPRDTRNSIFAGGSMVTSAWGYNWNNIFNTQLAAGRLYVLTNQPVGWYFTKTNYDRMIEWKDQPDNIEQNQAQVLYRKALQFHMPDLWAYRFLVVDF